MAKSKALIAAELKIAALEARLVVATTVFKAQRATIRELEAKLATRGCVATTTVPAAHTIAPIVTRYTDRFGVTFQKTRIGNRTTTIQVSA